MTIGSLLRRLFAVFPIAAGAAAPQALAENAVAARCGFVAGETQRVVRAVDGDTVVLDDGRRVRLIGLQAPERARPDKKPPLPADPFAERSRRILAELVEGRDIRLFYAGARHDRFGRMLAHLFLPENKADPDPESRSWVQAAMLREGAARVMNFHNTASCTDRLLAHEAHARKHRNGLWKLPDYAPRQAENLKVLLKERKKFTLVTGRVIDVGRTRNWTFINFGRDWDTDFTVTVEAKHRDRFPKRFFSRLAGKRIEIRGYLDRRKGPWMRLTYPQQLALLE